jgi:hypothetical protein
MEHRVEHRLTAYLYKLPDARFQAGGPISKWLETAFLYGIFAGPGGRMKPPGQPWAGCAKCANALWSDANYQYKKRQPLETPYVTLELEPAARFAHG